MSKSTKAPAKGPGGLTRDQVILALRSAAEQKGRGIPLKLVSRAALLLEVSPTTVREWARKDRKVAAAKREAEKVWRAQLDAKLEEVKKSMDGRMREMLEAAEHGELEKRCNFDLGLIEEFNREWTKKLARLARDT